MNFEFYSEMTGLPVEAIEKMRLNYARIGQTTEFVGFVKNIEEHMSFGELAGKMKAIAPVLDVDVHELMLLVLMESCGTMEKAFSQKGIDRQIFLNNLADFRCKVRECHTVYGVYGIDPFEWYQRFYEGDRFMLGRLQYETKEFRFDEMTIDGLTLKNGDTVVNCHIPSDGKLDYKTVIDSLRQAYDFFDCKVNGKIALVCDSWLLYPGYKGTVFAEGTNLYRFASLFQILSKNERSQFKNGWRVFNTLDVSDPSKLPNDTSLRRAFIAYMEKGGTFGTGYGIVILDDDFFVSHV